MNIVVLCGGLSPERDVSIVSGRLIANALIRRGHKVALIDVYEGVDLRERTPEQLFTLTPPDSASINETAPDLDEIVRRNGGRKILIGDGVMETCEAADAVFLALHGDMGENGKLQATLDNYKIKYTGSGYIGSLLAMDKDVSKRMLRQRGVRTPDWVYYDTEADTPDLILRAVGLPCVVKPTSCGSSVGVSIVENAEELEAALKDASKYERKLVVEKKITGREFSVGVLDGQVLPPIEICPISGFYDYKNKYQDGMTREICPAELSDEQSARAAASTLAAFDALRLTDYARIDFIMDKSGDFWCLEANTLPGMTPLSLLPREAAAAGIDYDELCETIVRLALKK